VNDNGTLEYRDVRFPAANEALTEAALLAACSAAGGPFAPTEDVYSYHLANPASLDGSFKPYFRLFTARQRAIGRACRRWPDRLVLYADIKRFYPSVSARHALNAWRTASESAGLDPGWVTIGYRLLEGQRSCKRGLLIGPLFSHVVGNLLLLEFDKAMRRRFPHCYFRYVDDVALVIPPEAKNPSLHFLREQLNPLQLRLNRDKIFTLSARKWLAIARYQTAEYGEEEMTDDSAWMHFIDGLKCFLMSNANRHRELMRVFNDEEIRISLPMYRERVEDPRYAERFDRRLASPKFKSLVANLTPRRLLKDAEALRQGYARDCEVCWEEFAAATGLRRKWLQSRLRYLLGRLMLLAREDAVGSWAGRLRDVAEFAEYQACFQAVASGDVSDLVQFSGKVCAAAGQTLATMRRPVQCNPKRWTAEAIEGCVTLALLGLDVLDGYPEWVAKDNQIRYTLGEFGLDAWSRTRLRFFEELFALAGATNLQRHRELLDAPSDPDERWVLFADELRGPSS
jgi:hypothetical protein